MNPGFAYTVVYVKNVAKSVAFYARAFGYNVRRIDESHRWGELESGKTTIAFTPLHQHETDDLTGAVRTPESGRHRPPVEVCFAYRDVDAAYKRAVESGAVPVSSPEEKEWGAPFEHQNKTELLPMASAPSRLSSTFLRVFVCSYIRVSGEK